MRIAAVLTLAVVLGLLTVPLSSATVMHATINTTTSIGTIDATSNYVLFFTYPTNSSVSNELNGTVVWYNATSYVNSSVRQQLENDMNGRSELNDGAQGSSNDSNVSTNDNTTVTSNSIQNQSQVHVVNATIQYQMHSFANQTNLSVYRNLTLHMTITNITKSEGNNTTVVDMSWRAFGVQGKLESNFHGMLELSNPNLGISVSTAVNSNMDVNELGDLGIGDSVGRGGDFYLGALFENGGFGGHLGAYNTINFHVFARPLSQWVRVYNSATNSTTFYYNTTSSFALNSTVNINGSVYSVKMKVDPSGALTTNGYAKPTSANTLAIFAAPAAMSATTISLIVVGIVVVVIVIALAIVAVRRRNLGK